LLRREAVVLLEGLLVDVLVLLERLVDALELGRDLDICPVSAGSLMAAVLVVVTYHFAIH
jgi:hypothetical protein